MEEVIEALCDFLCTWLDEVGDFRDLPAFVYTKIIANNPMCNNVAVQLSMPPKDSPITQNLYESSIFEFIVL